MSVLAHPNKHQANIASVQLESEPAVTSISVSARIEYIQRFSKQAVLVIDNDPAVYSQAASQFLASLSSHSAKEKPYQEANVAFISASSQLNDIQMRCRVIEQLFANTLFDPEKSLSVSIFPLIKQEKESITIVVEHAHALSLQVKFELCQLVELANKTHKKINVVLFGQEQAAQEVSNNKTIFTNKLAIIDAQSGQLFALDHAKFKNNNNALNKKRWKILTIAALTIITAVTVSWLLLIEHNTFTLAKLPLTNNAAVEQPAPKVKPENHALPIIKHTNSQANIDDITRALLHTSPTKTATKPAQAQDVLQALTLNETSKIKPLVNNQQALATTPAITKEAEVEQEAVEPVLTAAVLSRSATNNTKDDKSPTLTPIATNNTATLASKNTAVSLTESYYANQPGGYVIQFATFKALDVLPRFVKDFPQIDYYSYQRKLNEQSFIVLTSMAFSDRAQAMQMMKSLPKAILKSGPWLKSISQIKHEINTFKG